MGIKKQKKIALLLALLYLQFAIFANYPHEHQKFQHPTTNKEISSTNAFSVEEVNKQESASAGNKCLLCVLNSVSSSDEPKTEEHLKNDDSYSKISIFSIDIIEEVAKSSYCKRAPPAVTI